MRQPLAIVALLALGLLSLAPTGYGQHVPERYPSTTRVEVVDTVAGHAVPDPYAWLENQHAPDVRQWIDAQNRFTDAVLESLPSLRRVEARFLELFDVEEVQPPRLVNDRLYYMKRPRGAQRFGLYVRDGIDGEEQLLLDPAEIDEDPTVTIDFAGVYGSGKYLVYEVRQGGEDETEIRIRDLESGSELPDRLPRALYRSFSFDSGLSGFYYAISDKQGPVRVYYHRLGTEHSSNTLIFQSRRREERARVREVQGGRYLMASVGRGWRGDDLYLKRRDGERWEPIVEGIEAFFRPYWVNGELWVLTDHDAPNYRLVRIDPANPAPDAWEDIIPEGRDVLDGISLAAGKLFVRYLDNVSTRIEIRERDGTFVRNLELPRRPANASLPWNAGGTRVFFDFQSFTDPYRIYLYDVETTERSIWHIDEPPIDTDKLVVKQEWFESADGTRIPLFIVHKKGIELDGDNPTLLVGYGGFNAAWLPSFSRKGAPWVQQDGIFWLEQGGGVFAAANIRGGREFGRRWHRGGMRGFKQNAFNDFIAAAEHLIDRGYTRPSRLAIQGASNGGLLVGAAYTQRPDLFQAVLADLPELDLIGFPNYDQINPPALEEYGDATVPEEFEWIIEWSPLQNVRKGVEYPAVMITSGDMDSRVEPVQALKMTAKLQWATASDPADKPVILSYDARVGHSLGGRPVLDRIRFLASQVAFLNWQLGVAEPSTSAQDDSH